MPTKSFLSLPRTSYAADAFACFEPTDEFRIGNARAMIWLAQLSYENGDRDKLTEILERWDTRLKDVLGTELSLLPGLRLRDTSIVVATRGRVVLVACAGTEPYRPANLITDFDFPVVPDTGVHRGFSKASAALWDKLCPVLDRLGKADSLFFTGHSLGAALAALLACSALHKGLPIRGIYAFGMPRIGTPDFVERYNGRLGGTTYRLVYGRDIVARIPPANLLAGKIRFRYVGRSLFCPGGKFDADRLSAAPDPDGATPEAVQKDESEGQRPQDARSPYEGIAGRIIDWLPEPLRDHMPDRYWHALH